MKKNTKTSLKEECWSLDNSLVEWLNEHLKQYYEDASKYVKLDFHKFNYNGEILTQEQIIKRLIEITDFLLIDYYDRFGERLELMDKYLNEMYDLLKLVHWCLWW